MIYLFMRRRIFLRLCCTYELYKVCDCATVTGAQIAYPVHANKTDSAHFATSRCTMTVSSRGGTDPGFEKGGFNLVQTCDTGSATNDNF